MPLGGGPRAGGLHLAQVSVRVRVRLRGRVRGLTRPLAVNRHDAAFRAACRAHGWSPLSLRGTEQFSGFGAAWVRRSNLAHNLNPHPHPHPHPHPNPHPNPNPSPNPNPGSSGSSALSRRGARSSCWALASPWPPSGRKRPSGPSNGSSRACVVRPCVAREALDREEAAPLCSRKEFRSCADLRPAAA